MRCELLLAFAVALLLGCGAKTLEEEPCPDVGTALSYGNFGQAFLNEHCQSCHGGLGSDRQGAPLAYDFGSHELAKSFSGRIYVRAASVNTTMPPGPDDPNEAKRMQLAEWLACGAP